MNHVRDVLEIFAMTAAVIAALIAGMVAVDLAAERAELRRFRNNTDRYRQAIEKTRAQDGVYSALADEAHQWLKENAR